MSAACQKQSICYFWKVRKNIQISVNTWLVCLYVLVCHISISSLPSHINRHTKPVHLERLAAYSISESLLGSALHADKTADSAPLMQFNYPPRYLFSDLTFCQQITQTVIKSAFVQHLFSAKCMAFVKVPIHLFFSFHRFG